MDRVVIDTNVFASALMNESGIPSDIILLCLLRKIQPLMADALYFETEDVLGRRKVQTASTISPAKQRKLLNAYMDTCQWQEIFYRMRPNLRDENDNHIMDLAFNGRANWIITGNIKDFLDADLSFGGCRIVTPRQFIEERTPQWNQ